MEKRFVCMLVNFLLLLILICLNDYVTCQDHHDHGHDHGHATDDIKPELEGPSPFILTKTYLLERELKAIQNGEPERFSIDGDRVTEITERLLGRFNCSERLNGTCRECAEIITDRIFVVLGITDKQSGIDEEGFNKASVVLLHTISARNLQHECQTSSDLETIQDYVTSILGTGGTAGFMTKEDLKSMLNGMTSDYMPSSYDKCFDVDAIFSSVLHDPTIGAEDDEDVFKIATNLIVKLLEGQCIGHAQKVGPSTFVEGVFQTFSKDDYLSETELDEMMMRLSIGGDHSTHDHGTDDHAHEESDEEGHAHAEEDQTHDNDGHSDHSDHDHDIHRREVVRSFTHRQKRSDKSVFVDDDDHEGHDHGHEGHAHDDHDDDEKQMTNVHDDIHRDVVTSLLGEQCYTSHQLFDIYGTNHSVGISKSEFPEICPALIQQIISGACQHTDHNEHDGTVEASLEVWVYGMLSVVIISCCSLVGGFFLPCMSKDIYANFVNTLVALAIAVMSGDALIHLLPMALGLHVHGAGGHDDHDHAPSSSEFAYIWKCTVAMATVYAFFLFETIIGFVTGQANSHGIDQNQELQDLQPVGYPAASNQHADHTNGQSNGHFPADDVIKESGGHAYESGFSAEQMTADERSPQFVAGEMRGGLETKKATEPIEPNKSWICFRKGPLPIMIVIGDGLHNFGDGLAIGASFLAGIGPGVSTSLAVFCHELPHELGDLAVLLKSGITLKWALFLNFLSALTCIAGLVVGIILGVTLEARQWIFAVTAGTFLYVALVDMLPYLMRASQTKNPKLTFVLTNIGFLCGMAIILIIALYEDSITVNL